MPVSSPVIYTVIQYPLFCSLFWQKLSILCNFSTQSECPWYFLWFFGTRSLPPRAVASTGLASKMKGSRMLLGDSWPTEMSTVRCCWSSNKRQEGKVVYNRVTMHEFLVILVRVWSFFCYGENGEPDLSPHVYWRLEFPWHSVANQQQGHSSGPGTAPRAISCSPPRVRWDLEVRHQKNIASQTTNFGRYQRYQPFLVHWGWFVIGFTTPINTCTEPVSEGWILGVWIKWR